MSTPAPPEHQLVLVRITATGTTEWRCPACERREIHLIGIIWIRSLGADVPHAVAPDPLRRLGPRYAVLPLSAAHRN